MGATYTGFAHWLHHRTDVPTDRAEAIAAVGLGALFSARLLRLLLGRDPITIPDDAYVATWVRMIYAEITSSDDEQVSTTTS